MNGALGEKKTKTKKCEYFDFYVTAPCNRAKSCNFCECLHVSFLSEYLMPNVRDNQTQKKCCTIKTITIIMLQL